MRQDTEPLVYQMIPPGVRIHCLYGTGVETPDSFHYESFPDKEPKIIYSDGDGTVNLQSALQCQKWVDMQKQEVVVFELSGNEHIQMLSNDTTISYVKKLLFNLWCCWQLFSSPVMPSLKYGRMPFDLLILRYLNYLFCFLNYVQGFGWCPKQLFVSDLCSWSFIVFSYSENLVKYAFCCLQCCPVFIQAFIWRLRSPVHILYNFLCDLWRVWSGRVEALQSHSHKTREGY